MYYTSKEVYEHISKETNDPIVERKTCKISGAGFPIYKSDIEFYDKISPIFNGVKYQIPTPTLCPEERQRKRLMFRNERKLYKRKCDASGKDIVSIYSPEKPYKIYDQKYRWSDDWDPMDYGKDINLSLSFFIFFSDLIKEVPRISLNITLNENSDYSNHTWNLKNCYMVFDTGYCENSYYCHRAYHSADCLDCNSIYSCQNCYFCVECEKCFNCNNLNNCDSCSYSSFSYQCNGCNFIFLCNNLNNKEYCILNKQYTKQEYELKMKEILLNKEMFLELSNNIKENIVNKKSKLVGSEKCFGNNIINSSNCVFSFDVFNSSGSKYIIGVDDNDAFSQDVCHMVYTNHCFQSVAVAGKGHIGGYSVIYGESCFYCMFLENCNNCFGCFGLRNKQYCIFNKQYTKEEYEQLVPKIIEKMIEDGERGEFFDPSLSPFGYNETVAQEYFPLTRQEALDRGYKRQDNNYDPVIPEGANVVKSDQVESLKSDEEILKSIFICEISGRPFRIIKQELEFYRKHNLPLPRKHPDIRHEERMKLRPKRELHLRNCDKCGIEVVSVYPKDFEGTVYCESCYNKEVY